MKLNAVRKMEAEKQHSLIKSLELIFKIFKVKVKRKKKEKRHRNNRRQFSTKLHHKNEILFHNWKNIIRPTFTFKNKHPQKDFCHKLDENSIFAKRGFCTQLLPSEQHLKVYAFDTVVRKTE